MKEKKLFGKTINVGIYNYEVPVFYGNIDLLKVWAKKRYKEFDEEDILDTYSGFCYRNNPDKYLAPDFIYIGKVKNNYGTIAHESLHCALFLLAYCNVYVRGDTAPGHEALTYLTGYLVEQITKNNWSEYMPNKKKKWK